MPRHFLQLEHGNEVFALFVEKAKQNHTYTEYLESLITRYGRSEHFYLKFGRVNQNAKNLVGISDVAPRLCQTLSIWGGAMLKCVDIKLPQNQII